MSVFRTLGGGLGLWFWVYHPESTIVRRAPGPALTLYERVFLSLSLYTCTLCLMFSLDPSVVGLTPPCTCWRKDTITRLCASHTCVTEARDQWRACRSFLLVILPRYIKRFELRVEVAFNIRSAVTHDKINLVWFPLQSSNFECTDDAFVLLIRFCFIHL